MKTLKYILSFLIFIGFGNVSYGQNPSITSIIPNSVCKGDIVTITGSNMRTDTLTLRDGGTRIDFTSNIVSASSSVITVQIPTTLSNSGNLRFYVYKVGDNSKTDDESFTLNGFPVVSLSIDNAGTTNVCQSSNSRDLNFNVSGNSNGDNVLITYSINGVIHQTAVSGNNDFDTTITPTISTTYTVVEVENQTTGCSLYPINETLIFNVAPLISGTLSTSDNELCLGESTSIIFSINNPNNDNMKVYYKKNNGATIDTTISTSLITLLETPTSTTTYELTKIENLTQSCEKIFTTNNEQTITVRQTPATAMNLLTSTSICYGEEIQLRLENNTIPNDFINVFYTEGGTASSKVIENDTTLRFPNSTLSTTFTLTGVELANHGCYQSLTTTPITVMVQPEITGTLTASQNMVCNGDSVDLYFTANNPNSDVLIFYYSDGSNSLTTTTSGTFISFSSGALSTATTFTLNSIENVTTGCTETITTNNTITVDVNNTMDVTMSSSVTSLCFGGTYNLNFAITGSEANDNITIQYSQDGVTLSQNIIINPTNTNTTVSIPIIGNQTFLYSLVSITNNTTGCSTSYSPSVVNSIQVNVTPAITASISTSSTSICAGSGTNLIFSVSNPNNETITINYTDGTTAFTESTTTNSKVVSIPSLTNSTTYTLTSVETPACVFNLVANNTATVTVNNIPDVTMALVGSGVSCSGSNAQIQFTISDKVNSSDYVTVNYLDNNGQQTFTTQLADTTINVAPPSTTVFSLISITNTAVGCSNFDLSGAGGSVTVTAGNNLTGELQVSTNEICSGESVTLNFIINGAVGNTDLTYSVDGVSQTATITGSTLSLPQTLTTSTIFQLTELTAVNTGCPGDTINNSATQSIIVNSLPNVTLSAANNTNSIAICNLESTDLQFEVTGGTPPFSLSYLEGNSGFNTNISIGAGITPETVNPAQNSVYTISNFVDNKGCQDASPTGSANVTINSLPLATLSVNDNMICNGESVFLTFSVSNNGNDVVSIQYNEVVNNAVINTNTIQTNGSTIISVTPNQTTTYIITGVENTITNCSNIPTLNISEEITVNESPNVINFTTINNTDTVCDGSIATVEFTFLNNGAVSPFTVFYQDSFSNQTGRSPELSWTNLSFNSIENLLQTNTSSSIVSHFFFITRVIDGNGCETTYSVGNEPSVEITINPTPSVSLNGVQSLPYASTDAIAYPLQGVPSGGTISGAGVGITNPNTTTADFIPANVNAVFTPPNTSINVTLIYSLTDGAGCTGSDQVTAVVNEAAEYNFFSDGLMTLDTLYCRNSDSTFIYATVDDNGMVGAIGGNTFVLNPAMNDKVFKNIQIIGDTARITINPLDSSGVFSLQFGSVSSGFITKQITVVDTINTSFSPFINGDTLCQITDNVRLIGIPSLADNSNATFSSPTVNLITQNVVSPTNTEWFMEYSIAGEHSVKYTFIDNSTGCVTNATQIVNITPRPIADYTTTIDCNNKSITFTDNSIIPLNIVSDNIVLWEWEYGDGTDSVRSQFVSDLDYQYSSSGTYTTSLSVTSAFGCTNTFDTTIIIGVQPNMDFSWRFSTLGENTELVNLSTGSIGGTVLDDINSLIWSFGDGTSNVTTILDTVLHTYVNTGIFQVGLTAQTDNGCFSDTTFNIYILPKEDTYPYYERFNSSDGEWIANPVSGNVWHWADSVVFNNNNRAWITDSVTTYPLGSDIFVFSPVFDFTTIEKPLVSFLYHVNSRVSDGGVFQYSIDDGQTWNILGDLTSGLEWYNVANLVAQPGEQSGLSGFGWTGNTSTGWNIARHKLDELRGESKVRFRFAFASVAGGNNIYDGFAFDDFFIGERQKRVLLERFTNVGVPNYNLIQDTVYQRLADNDLDVVMVEYHNALPVNDAFNIFNPADPSGRSLYYQFSQTGKTVIDGVIDSTVTPNTTNFGWTQQDLDLSMLVEPTFNISIDNLIINNGVLDITTTVKARKPLPADIRKVYIAVVEDNVDLDNITHRNILRKLLPSNAGTSLTNSWSIGTSQTVSQSWTFDPNMVDATNLKAVVWIQHNDSRLVYQTAFSDLPNITFDSTVVNTAKLPETDKINQFSLYPNPSNGQFTIELNQSLDVDFNWQLWNINGQMVHQGYIYKNQQRVEITATNLPKGMYFFRMYNEEGISTVRKVMIQ